MQYESTRNPDSLVESAMAIKMGLSPEGGLFVPTSIPKLTQGEIMKLAELGYNARAVEILKLYLTDFSLEEVKECVDHAYNKDKFETVNIAPIYQLHEQCYFLELWHGPTCAFKDMALQILPHLLIKSAQKTGEDKEIVILVATSGDTGKAALEGFKNVPGTRIIVFYPNEGVSDIQKLQMVTQEGDNVHVMAVKGNFDDAQNGVKKIFTDPLYAAELSEKGFVLSSANSINWGRLLPQIVYYFSTYADLMKNEEINPGDKINVVVPTGNFGNILACYYAKEMGLPIHKMICASNENNVLTDFIHTGIYDRNRTFKLTASPSMDILISSNLERLLFLLANRDATQINAWMDSLKTAGKYEVDSATKEKITASFWAGSCDDAQTFDAIRQVSEQFSYVMDTHTAVGKCVYDQYVTATGDKTKTVIASTASPFKFSQDVLSALQPDEDLSQSSAFELLQILSEQSGMRIPPALGDLRNKTVRFGETCEKEDMQAVVSTLLEG
ncbi:MAG: threonine synthase [Hyphomonadaceae bacterium]|nr:threonine synthase [Clostridia bacterium]